MLTLKVWLSLYSPKEPCCKWKLENSNTNPYGIYDSYSGTWEKPDVLRRYLKSGSKHDPNLDSTLKAGE